MRKSHVPVIADSVGPELIDAVVHVLKALDAAVELVPLDLFEGDFDLILNADPARRATTHFAMRYQFRSLPGVEAPRNYWRRPIDFALVVAADPLGQAGSLEDAERLHISAFDIAIRQDAKRVTLVHARDHASQLDTILAEAFWRIAKEVPSVQAGASPIDRFAESLVGGSDHCGVVVAGPREGDAVRGIAGGLIGGLRYVPAIALGDVCEYGAFHGSSSTRKDEVDPTALLLSVTIMLENIGMAETAKQLDHALTFARRAVARIPDLGYPPAPFRTSRFTRLLIQGVHETRKNARA